MRDATALLLTMLLGPASLLAGPDLPAGVYELRPDSAYLHGCYPPCRCALSFIEGVRGSARVSAPVSEEGFLRYDLSEVSWTIPSDPPVEVTGAGRYRISDDGARHELQIDLVVGDAESRLFQSGLLDSPPQELPSIEIPISLNGMVCLDEVFEIHLVFPRALFLRGDCNGDGTLDITDPVADLAYQFLGSFHPGCVDALDYDNSGELEVTDAILSLGFQFLGGPPPAPPGKDRCGADEDEVEDDLGCESFPICEEEG